MPSILFNPRITQPKWKIKEWTHCCVAQLINSEQLWCEFCSWVKSVRVGIIGNPARNRPFNIVSSL